jgi:hypothetical protein
MCQTCSLAQLRPTATGGCLQAPTRSLKTAVFSRAVKPYAGPARGAAAVRDRRAWTQRRRIRLRLALPTRARLRHASTPEHLLCAYGGLRPNGMAGFSAARPTVVRVVVRRLGPTTGARAPVARVPASLSPALGSALSMPAATGDTGLHARAFDRRLLSCAPTLPGARPTHLTPCRACI